jgi:hypothetical protein
MTYWYFTLMHRFLARDTRITILEGPFTGQKGWVDCIAFQQPTGSEERAFCYQATLESGSGLRFAGTTWFPGGSAMTIWRGSWKDCPGRLSQ